MKKLTVLLSLLLFSFPGSQAFAISPGVYSFSGTVTIEAYFATGDDPDPLVTGEAPFCFRYLTVSEPDGNGVQTITGSDDPNEDYGVSIAPITMILNEIDLYATGPITGFLDTNGGNIDATVRTWGNNQPLGPPGWWTEITPPSGLANTVVMTIPLNSMVLTPPPPPVQYGDPAATTLTATAEFSNDWGLTSVSEDGSPLADGSFKIVSPDAHFRGGLVLLDVISFTMFEGDLSENTCPAVDYDGDGVLDYDDNCPGVANPPVQGDDPCTVEIETEYQVDSDCDGVGDACEDGYECIDIDKDGFGYPASPECYYELFDCNDLDEFINPLMPEELGNGIDENCDGLPCFIATAAFGTPLNGKIEVLRDFRDDYLIKNPAGQVFVSAYYKYSPPVARYVAEHVWLRTLVRTLLLPVIGFVSLFV